MTPREGDLAHVGGYLQSVMDRLARVEELQHRVDELRTSTDTAIDVVADQSRRLDEMAEDIARLRDDVDFTMNALTDLLNGPWGAR